MSDPPPYIDDPDTAEPPPQNAPVHLAGAGTAVVGLLLVSLSMLFAASIVAYLIIRAKIMAHSQSHQWPPPGLPEPPESLWLSTLAIIGASVTIQLALSAVRREDKIPADLSQRDPAADTKPLVRWLSLTLLLGVVFLALQTFNWIEFYNAIPHAFKIQGPYLGMFFTLTGLHALHVIGGLIPLAVVTWRAKQGRYSRNFHPGVRYVALYWHFLDIIWLALFTVIMAT